MIHCPFCQEENQDEAQYCLKCGKPIREVVPEKKKGNAGWLIVTILSVLIALAAAGGAYYFYRQTTEKLNRAETNTQNSEAEEQLTEEEKEEVSPEEAAAEIYEPYITTGKQAVFFEWQKRLENSEKENNGYAEIINTRVIKIKENENEYFKDVDCVVEFVIRTDEAGSAPYYFTSSVYDNAVFYRDGTCRAASGFFRTYAQSHDDYADYVEEIFDFGDRYRETLPPRETETDEESTETTDAAEENQTATETESETA